jgi:hypothetical protein
MAPGGSLIISGSIMTGSDNNWHEAGRNSRSFLLRCWQEEPPQGADPTDLIWRFALVPLNDSSKARGFACLEELTAALRAELIAAADVPV